MKDLIKKAIAAGIMISIGGTVKMSCSNEIVGSFLFSLGLFVICSYGLNLYTGKVGYFSGVRDIPRLLCIWLFNGVGCAASAICIRIAKPTLVEAAAASMEKKLACSPLQTAILAAFCGALMYLAVDNFKKTENGFRQTFGVVMCVTCFLLSGFEHSIADMFYAFTGVSSPAVFLHYMGFLLLVSLFNGVGSVLICWLSSSVSQKS